jgi:O-antigen/teichoic acid export membrane protein
VTPTTVRDALARNTFWYGLVTLVGLVSGLAMSVVLARGLGPALMGDFSFLTWMSRTLESAAMLGFGVALVRYSADALARGEPAVARGLISLLFRWELVSVATVVTGTLALTLVLAPSDLRWPMMVIAVGIVPIATESFFMRATYGAQRYDLTAQVSTIKMTLLMTVSVVAVLMGAGLFGLLLAQALGTVVSCVLQTRGALSLYPREAAPVPSATREELRRYLVSFSLVGVLETFVWDRSEIFFLKLWLPSEEIAFYSLAFGLAARAMIIPAIFVGALLPALASLHGAGDDREFTRVYRTSLRSVTLVGAPIAAVSAGVAPALVALLYGESYAPVVLLFRILVGVSLLGVMRDVAWAALRATASRRSALTAAAVTAIVDLGLAALLVRPYGTAGAVTANTVAQVTLALWAFIAIQAAKRPGFPVGDMARIGTAAALALLAASTTGTGHGVVPLLVGIAAGFLTYAVACVLLGAVNARDWTMLITSSRRFISSRAGA